MKKAALVISPPFWIKTPPLGIEYIKNYAGPGNWEIDIFDLNMYFYKLMNIPSQQWLTLSKVFEESLFDNVRIKYPDILQNITKNLAEYEVIGFSLFKRNLPFSLKLSENIKQVWPLLAAIQPLPWTSLRYSMSFRFFILSYAARN